MNPRDANEADVRPLPTCNAVPDPCAAAAQEESEDWSFCPHCGAASSGAVQSLEFCIICGQRRCVTCGR